MFNSALIYELAVLKPYAEPLLYSIEKGEPEYFEAVRLFKIFELFSWRWDRGASEKLDCERVCGEAALRCNIVLIV